MATAPPDKLARVRRVTMAALSVLDLLLVLAIGGVVLGYDFGPAPAAQQPLLRGLDLALLAFFLAEWVVRVALAERRLRFAASRWYDALALAALLDAAAGGRATWSWFLVRGGAAGLIALARAGWVRRLVGRLWRHPAPLLVGSFAGAILLGTALLALPIASESKQSIGVVNALFTATSAVCVTGLTVLDTGTAFTLFGQVVILALIQLGGLGIMTFSAAMFLMAGRAISASQGVALQSMLDQESAREARTLVRFIALLTLAVEAAGAVALFFCFAGREGYTVQAVYSAVFHSVSAFCNAGFSLYGRSFVEYRGHLGLNLTITTLIIVGGLGFPVLRDLLVVGRRQRLGEGRSPRLHTQTKVVLTTSAILIVGGALVFYLLELPSTLGPMRPGERVLASYFQSVTTRTAGFNTVDIAAVRTPVLVVLMFLMFVGASPGGTGGGIKTTTAAILFQAMRSAFRRRPEVELFGRTVPRSTIRRSIALVTLSALLLLAAAVALTSAEPRQPFDKLVFEQVSAFGTVGLSTGITAALSDAGKLIILALMFAGRIGPLTLMFSLLGEGRPARYKYPNTHIMVG
ncbi:MAG: hypothetical protein FJ290_20370 [Planctomycetes bacterium]|nr:hypothetical protein [Planctomycetota bacterium]